jgi:hypothetical protein
VESPIHRAALRDELAAAVSGPETVRPPVIYEQVRVPDLAADRQRILGPVLRSRLSQIDPVLAEVYRARVHNWVLRQPTSIGRTLEAHAYQGVT